MSGGGIVIVIVIVIVVVRCSGFGGNRQLCAKKNQRIHSAIQQTQQPQLGLSEPLFSSCQFIHAR